MDVSYIKKAIDEIFSKSGYKIDKFTLFCPNILDVQLIKTDKDISFIFTKVMPSVKTSKLFFPITAYVEGISLNEIGGSIKLKYFPDFEFKYSGYEEKKFGSSDSKVNLEDFRREIDKKYRDEQRRKIAYLALQYANQWATIIDQNGISYEYCKENREELTKNCESFVIENIVKSNQIKARSAVLTFVLINLILPAVVAWVVKRFLDKFLDNK